jgi:putative SOS response-associated peptidase YedK
LCGRLNLRSPAAAWCQQFLPEFDPEHLPASFAELPPRYNVAPTQSIVCIYRESTGEARQPMLTRWGLVPSWAKDLSIGNRMINARSETVDSKPSFRKAFTSRRCLIPADGYYEWKQVSDGKQPYLFEHSGGQLLALAGLWEENSKVAASPLRTCTIITTSANQSVSAVHDRMPVLLSPADQDQWLDPGFRDPAALMKLLRPAPEDLLAFHPVSRRVNNARNDDEACQKPD